MSKKIESVLLSFVLIICTIFLPLSSSVKAISDGNTFIDQLTELTFVDTAESGIDATDDAKTFNVNCINGNYKIRVEYIVVVAGDSSIDFSLTIDGKYPSDLFQKQSLRRFWENDGKIRTDKNGNQFAAKQICSKNEITDFVYCSDSFNNSDTVISLTGGEHLITFSDFSDTIEIIEIKLIPICTTDYKALEKSYKDFDSYNGNPIYIQGESAKLKSQKNIIPKCDNSDVSLMPSSTKNDVINYIGSSSWQTQGDEIVWSFNVEKSAVYAIGFKYRQNLVENGNSYRCLKIDGDELSTEFSNLCFSYSRKWKFKQAEVNDTPMCLYLDKGTHTISMGVTAGEIGSIVENLSLEIEKIGALYRQIVMITGESVDAQRSYNLFEQIPDFNIQLKNYYDKLNDIADKMEKISGKGQSAVSTIRSMCVVLKEMLDNPYSAHEYKNSYYTQYCSLSSCLYEMVNMPLDIDYITLYSPNEEPPKNESNVFSSVIFHIKRFIFSFTDDYVTDESNNSKSIDLWINTGRDQAQVLGNLVSTDFTEKTKISVNMKLTNASVIQAILSGTGPDCVLNLARSEPVNLAMRGALCNLSEFKDFESVRKRFATTAFEPYEYQGGYYALPDTQSFSMMFYRSDILSQLSCEIPKTWDDFLAILAVLQRNNLQAGVGSNDMNMYATLLMQNGGSLYSTDKKTVNLDDELSIKSFIKWCEFFTDYKMPVSADYYNRFRIGIMPVIVANYSMYITLKVAAPEISGKWGMVGIPGILMPDGTINNSQSSTGTGCAILKTSKNAEYAWEFLKWWTDTETQLSYSEQVETLIGVSGRVQTANVEALSKMSWDNDAGREILSQWKKINDIPEIPGGYYVSRVITQAYWNVVSNGQDARDTLSKWSDIAKSEILRKRKQYNLDS